MTNCAVRGRDRTVLLAATPALWPAWPFLPVGRTDTHLVVSTGTWTVWLGLAGKARYPDVVSVIPRHAPTVVGVDDHDAAELLAALPKMPGASEEHRPVTLDVDGTVRVRSGDPAIPRGVKELTLSRSPVAGSAARVALDRRVLARALAMGCRTLRLTPEKPLAAEGEGVVLVAAQLDPALIVPLTADGRTTSTGKPDEDPIPIPINPERRPEMKPETNGQPARDDPPDPLDLAEELRDALADATAKAARLVAVLRQSRKEKKVISALLGNLKQLNLGTGGPR